MNNIVYVGKNLITFSMHRHSHESWELVYCTGGSGQFVFDSSTMKYTAGDIVIIPPGASHMNNSDEGFTNIHIYLLPSMTRFIISTAKYTTRSL